ncbi:arsenite transport subunit B [Heterostelium album PN500]|uniref:Arsenite transport subunit B n=1 Tax=Heterostelium pallidum (strain ATCC 26659 / Pp 5 / PN500) TaxID=670386 RepID=D3BH72_HETP5|nr:arsenite transport subunit B [Heterostelium album PN500]EFA79456.1 arsenite transport subunit B [Heterostelium album PN500]|eukprot:XP_020431577.1 arsenite transport subunit B [Heterostelium album PN500]
MSKVEAPNNNTTNISQPSPFVTKKSPADLNVTVDDLIKSSRDIYITLLIMKVIELGDSVKPFVSGPIFLICLLLICFKKINVMPIGRAGVALVGSVNFNDNVGNCTTRTVGICCQLGYDRSSNGNDVVEPSNGICRYLVEYIEMADVSLFVGIDADASNLPYLPYLLAVATSANIGSAALPVGNPQNMIIATASGVEFLTFFKVSVEDGLLESDRIQGQEASDPNSIEMESTINIAPGDAKEDIVDDGRSEEVSNGIIINGNQAADLHEFKDDVNMDEVLLVEESNQQHGIASQRTNEQQFLLNREKLIGILKMIHYYRSGVVLLLVLIGFCVGLHMGFTVMLGVSILMLIDRKDVSEQIKMVDWELLVFFGGLFILVDGFDREFSKWAWRGISPWIPLDGNPLKIFVFTILVLISCNVFSNVPLVLALSPHLIEANAPPFTWLLLAFISTVAGNLN